MSVKIPPSLIVGPVAFLPVPLPQTLAFVAADAFTDPTAAELEPTAPAANVAPTTDRPPSTPAARPLGQVPQAAPVRPPHVRGDRVGRADDGRQDSPEELLRRDPRRRGGRVQRRDRPPVAPADRRGDRAQADLELLVDEGPALRPHLPHLDAQPVGA